MATHIIISDVHLGSPHCRRGVFRSFLERLPPDAELILAGDTIDDPTHELPTEDLSLLERLYAMAAHRPVTFILGNHDEGWRPGVEHVAVCRKKTVGGTVHVAHGDDFDNLMPRSQWFIVLFRRFHRLRMRLGARPVHVAHYAKKWGALYRLLRRCVMSNAVQYARENGMGATVCGHVHFAEHTRMDGVDYFNTGSWTENQFYCVVVDQGGPRLEEFKPEAPSCRL